MKKFPVILSCDWFSYSCYVPYCFRSLVRGKADEVHKLYKVYKLGSYEFEIKESKEFHPCFMFSVMIEWHAQEVCTLMFGDKRSSASHAGVAKVANSFLYYGDWAKVFLKALRAVGWRHTAIKRVDVCADFEFFMNGRKPLQFIHDYLSKPTDTRPSFIRKSSNKYVATGVRSVAANIVQSVRWGTRESPVQVNLYNKTQELADVKMKPWIVAKWNANGLTSGIDQHGKAHWVWRVEFSINASQLALRFKDKSKVFDISLNDVADQASLANLFQVLVPNYFQFYFLTPANVRDKAKVRDLAPVDLFDLSDCHKNVTTMTLARAIGSGRTERLLAKRLIELRGSSKLSEEQRQAVLPVIDLLLNRAASLDSVDYSDGEDVIANIIYELTTPDTQKLSKMSRTIAAHNAKRFARLLRCGNSHEFADYAWACEALQLDLDALRHKISQVLQQAPDEAYECWVDEDIDLDIIQCEAEALPDMHAQNLQPFDPDSLPDYPDDFTDTYFGL